MYKGKLRGPSGISLNVIAKLGKDEPIAMESLIKISETLKINFGDIVSIEEKDSG